MNIFFNQYCYNLNEDDKLLEDAPFFKEGIEFINQFSSGQSSFQFKSSGATGTAKVIAIDRNQILASIRQTEKVLGLKKGETALVCLSPNFVATKMMLARCMVIGMDIVLVEPSSNPFEMLDTNTRLDFASFVPLQVRYIMNSSHANMLNGIKNILIGGGPIDWNLEKSLSSINTNIYHTYGMTETVSHVALRKLNSGNKFFEVLGDTQVYMNNEGCLNIKGEVTNNQTVVTNDMVEFGDRRKFKWLGRKDNLINSGGVKVIPEQLEEFLTPLMLESHISSDFFLYGVQDNLLGQKLVIILEDESKNDGILQLISNHIEARFGKYHIPKEIYCVKKFARTNSGKIRRKETVKLIESKL